MKKKNILVNSIKISVIILNFNGKKYLKDCLGSIKEQAYSSFETIFVDNGSTDGSVAFVKKEYPEVIIVENKKNLGFAEGNNRGMEKARGKYILVINNDTKSDKNLLENLVKAIEEDEKIGMVAPKILSLKNPGLIDSIGINIYPDAMSRGRERNKIDSGQYEKEELLLPSGCAALYRKEMLDEIGFFDSDFFAYCEDTDLGLRGRLMGWKCVSAPSAVVYHYYSGTVGELSPMKAFLVERNHFFVAIKNFPIILVLMLPFYTILRYLFLIYGLLRKNNLTKKISYPKIKLISILIKSYVSFFLLLPSMLKKRRVIQGRKKISSRDFLKLIKKHRLKLSEITLKE